MSRAWESYEVHWWLREPVMSKRDIGVLQTKRRK
nr:MAG TPA: hypothetical protein [Herelleviridae sp.]